jgi:hypothetical protein
MENSPEFAGATGKITISIETISGKAQELY